MAVFDLSIIDLWDELELDFVWNMSMMIGGATNWSSAPQLGKVLKKMHIEHLYFTVGKLGQFWWPDSVINNRDRHKLAVRRKGRSLLSWCNQNQNCCFSLTGAWEKPKNTKKSS